MCILTYGYSACSCSCSCSCVIVYLTHLCLTLLLSLSFSLQPTLHYSTAKAMANAAFQPHPKFGVYFNLDGWALTNLTTGFGPVSNMSDALAQISLLNLFQLVFLFLESYYP